MAPAPRNRVKRRIAKDAGEAVINGSKSVVGAVSSIFAVRKRLGHAPERLKMELEESSPVSRATQSGADSYSGIVATGFSASPADEPRMSTSEEVAIIVERSTVVTATEPESPPAAVVDERMTTGDSPVTDPESLAGAVADETLRVVDELSSPTRTNPITAIHARVDSADALKYKGSMLYQNEEGDWVVEELPLAEGISMSVATSATQIVYPTLTMV